MTPHMSLREFIADGVVHAVGVVLSIIAMTALAISAAASAGVGFVFAVVAYGAAAVFSFVVSAFYNMWPLGVVKDTLLRADFAGIHFKIAGTFTPIVVFVGSTFGYVVLGAVWLAAVVGTVGRFLPSQMPTRLSLALYLAQGWAALFLIWPMLNSLSVAEMILMGLGGVVYTAGVVFHVREDWPYQRAIWHGFVLVASSLFFVAIAQMTLRAAA